MSSEIRMGGCTVCGMDYWEFMGWVWEPGKPYGKAYSLEKCCKCGSVRKGYMDISSFRFDKDDPRVARCLWSYDL